MNAKATEILNEAAKSSENRFAPGKALVVTDEGDVVEAGSVPSGYVLCGENGTIPLSLAQSLGLDKQSKSSSKSKAADAPASASEPAPDASPAPTGVTITDENGKTVP